jgi:hypothetical protein
MTLNSSCINSEINGDVDELLESNRVGKRLGRRIKRNYYNSLAKNCLNNLKKDPLNIFGPEAKDIMLNIEKVPFSSVGEIKIGTKTYTINEHNSVVSTDSKL